eukprot:1073503-Pelagomonas_calceolata.AAC.1
MRSPPARIKQPGHRRGRERRRKGQLSRQRKLSLHQLRRDIGSKEPAVPSSTWHEQTGQIDKNQVVKEKSLQNNLIVQAREQGGGHSSCVEGAI